MEILRKKQGFIISQRQFTLELLREFDSSGAAVSYSLDPYCKLHAEFGPPLTDPIVYCRIIGKLNYLTNTILDLFFTVLSISQYMQRPLLSHFSAALHVLRYFHVNPAQGIFLSADPSFDLLALCDADWAACRDSRRFVSGFFITLRGSPISWKSKKQVSMSLSSTEAEYRSMRKVTAKITWLVRLLRDLSILRLFLSPFILIAKPPFI
ncbi:secreted RxLR effector protein 161-like [Nicotiana sylvestris]|uniref:secreted RxLR effector protein 161-like n=1 Tax=Nicotiana sylvestris TaxID=4096 RepID=UPI00388C793F